MDNYIGEIRPISFTYAPKGWALCNGQLLTITQNQALYALLGTQFGGDGISTFGLPDLRSRVPVGTGQLQGGSTYTQGQRGGAESVTLLSTQLPTHAHGFSGTLKASGSGDDSSPVGQLPGTGTVAQYTASNAPNTSMGAPIQGVTQNAGGNQAHENRPPVLAINYVIALQGLYPPRP